MNQSKIDTNTTQSLSRPPNETPDIRLTKFLCSGEIVLGSSDKTPQQELKEIINDKRWTRRMLEDWFKKGPQSKYFSVTPNPEFRAIYLILLSLLEDHGKETVSTQNTTETGEEQSLDERISEHFDTGSTWEKVDMQWKC